MKHFVTALLALLLLLATFVPAVWSMPPHPDLARKIQNHEIPEPYYLQHLDELRAQGVENPPPTRTIDVLAQRALDEDINILAILVDFDDHVSRVQPVFFDSLLYANHTATLRDYYRQVSYGRLNLITVNMPSQLGWQRAPQNYAYYVNGAQGFGAYPQNAQRLTEDCIHMVDSLVDFSQYDNNGDGHVDALFIIHSGRGAEYTGSNDDIWSHAWTTRTPQHVDGVIADRYSMEPEYWQALNDMTCGVYCHEMGHAVFGLPDLYDTGYTSEGLGTWSIMAGGSWNGNNGNSPAHPDAWCRIHMGFAEATTVTTNLSNVSLPYVEQSPVIYRLWSNGAMGNEYYLVENRQQHGYDLHLRGNGLLIYHVDDSQQDNTHPWYPGHTGSGHYWVAVEQADGDFHLERDTNSGDMGDTYPNWDSLSFTSSTEPSSRSYAGNLTRVSIFNISSSADTMTANLAVRPGVGNLVSVVLPDTNVIAGDTIFIPVMIDSISGQNVTSLHFTLTFDSTILQPLDPYFDLTGGMIPQSWTVTSTQSLGSVSINASGAAPLDGQGLLVKLRVRVLPSSNQGLVSSLAFSTFVFNQGTPRADPASGSLTVSTAHILLQPSSLSFGNVGVGQSLTRAFVVRNNGNAALDISSLTFSAPFSIEAALPITVMPGQWTPLQVIFHPTDVQLYRDTVIIESNAAEGTVRLPLSGSGSNLNANPSADALPTQFALLPNFPNPFNPSTVLNFDVPRSAKVTIKVYDVLGRMIDTPLNDIVEPGHHSISWSCPSCGSGIYLFAMSAEGNRYVQKAMFMK